MRIAICVAILAVAAVCSGAPILDQYFEYDTCAGIIDPCGGSVGGIWSDNAQTFTAGLTGRITSIQVLLQGGGNAGDLHFELLPTAGGVPVEDLGLALAIDVRPAGSIPGAPTWITFELAGPGIPVQAGDVLAIAIRDPSGGCCATYIWRGSVYADLYAGGQRFVRGVGAGPVWNGGTIGTPPSNEANVDLNFRVYVDAEPAGVPEPGTWTMTAAGILAIAWAATGSGARSWRSPRHSTRPWRRRRGSD